MSDIGGQAVIEGVMMRSGNVYAIAVRSPDKEIVCKKETIRELPKPLKWPIIRGVVALGQALSIGIRALLYSAEASGHEEEKPSDFSLFMTVLVSFVIGIGLFFLLPLYGTKLLGTIYSSISDSSLMFNLVDGVIRVAFFLMYILSIRMLKDIRRVFQYHGAEHKVVHAFEAGVELTPQNADNFSTLHPRCGTSFLIMVMLLSILVFSLIPKDWPFIEKFVSRIVLIPLIAGLSYEFIKMSSKKMNNPVVRYLSMPGLWLQKLTTGIPSPDQIEVAIKALTETLSKDSTREDSAEIKTHVVG
ncbi:MAG: DUF1385 domain-containing protein [Nitrospiraceae bacterium]|nr:MAG: DUF1385 domain-containing protein [Nitrospiraceae bacterium]